MAEIRQAHQMGVESGPGWSRTALVDSGGRGLPMRAERWRLDPGADGPTITPSGAETMIYVIAGSGTARIEDTAYALAPETVIWLTAGDRVALHAGADGLEILVGAAAES